MLIVDTAACKELLIIDDCQLLRSEEERHVVLYGAELYIVLRYDSEIKIKIVVKYLVFNNDIFQNGQFCLPKLVIISLVNTDLVT